MEQIWRSPRIRPGWTTNLLAAGSMAVIVLVSAPGALAAEPSPQDSYIAARDGYIKKFKGAPDCPACVDTALTELAKPLQAAVGPVSVPGFPGAGKINLRTLVGEVGFGKLDALRFGDSAHILLATTRALVERFAAGHKDLPKDIRKVAQANAFYEYALPEDAAFANFVRIQDPKVPGIDLALGSVGAFAQELSGKMPDQVVVFAKKGDRIYLVQIPAAPVPANIPQCDEIWKASAVMKTDYKLLLRRYQDCVRDKVQTPANLAAWKAQVQGILETLAKAP